MKQPTIINTKKNKLYSKPKYWFTKSIKLKERGESDINDRERMVE